MSFSKTLLASFGLAAALAFAPGQASADTSVPLPLPPDGNSRSPPVLLRGPSTTPVAFVRKGAEEVFVIESLKHMMGSGGVTTLRRDGNRWKAQRYSQLPGTVVAWGLDGRGHLIVAAKGDWILVPGQPNGYRQAGALPASHLLRLTDSGAFETVE